MKFTGSPIFGRPGGTTGYEVIACLVSVVQTFVPSFLATGVPTLFIIPVSGSMA